MFKKKKVGLEIDQVNDCIIFDIKVYSYICNSGIERTWAAINLAEWNQYAKPSWVRINPIGWIGNNS